MSQQNLTPSLILICTTILYSQLPIANSLTLEMFRRDSFDFNLFPKNLSYAQKNRIFAQLSHSRVRRLQARLDPESSARGSVIDTIQPPIKQLMDSLFGVKVEIGSKPYRTYLAVDSGSDVLWVQCVGCEKCFRIKNGVFNQSASTSYHNIRFDHPLCKPRIQDGDNCKFTIGYGAGQAEGIRALESLHFKSSKHGQRITVPNILLGCAKVAHLTFGENDGANNVISGIFGLALGFTKHGNSFLELTQKFTKMKFSYCFPSWSASKSISIPLSFGDDVPRLHPSAMSTPMDDLMYYLSVSDISVGGRRLHLNPSVFKRRRDGKGGFCIDSGAGHTFLVQSAYDKVEQAVSEILASQSKHPVDPPRGYVGWFCYKWPLKIKNPESLTVTYHMENNANLEVRFEDLFMKQEFVGTKKRFTCFTFSPTDEGEVSILGAAHQANYRFVYDLNHKALHFKHDRC